MRSCLPRLSLKLSPTDGRLHCLIQQLDEQISGQNGENIFFPGEHYLQAKNIIFQQVRLEQSVLSLCSVIVST